MKKTTKSFAYTDNGEIKGCSFKIVRQLKYINVNEFKHALYAQNSLYPLKHIPRC